MNAPPDLPASVTAAGPTLAPEELAGHKLLALLLLEGPKIWNWTLGQMAPAAGPRSPG